MTNNWGSVQPHLSLSTQQIGQKQPMTASFSGTHAKSSGFKAKTHDTSEQVQSPVQSGINEPNCSQRNTRKPRSKPQYLGPVRLTKKNISSICWWAKCDGGSAPRGFMQVLQSNGKPSFQLIYPKSEVGLKNKHLLNTRKPSRIAAVFVDKDGQSDPVWIDLKREALIQCD